MLRAMAPRPNIINICSEAHKQRNNNKMQISLLRDCCFEHTKTGFPECVYLPRETRSHGRCVCM